MKRVFIGMETSGELRNRFVDAGCDVFSCDLLPSDDLTTRHLQADVFETLKSLRALGWWPDIAVFHPTCTYLTNSAAWAFNDPDFTRYPGVGYHQCIKSGTLTGQARRDARESALGDVRRIMALPIRTTVIENPVGAISNAIRKPNQIIQPYQFGDDASKATCLWFNRPGLSVPIDPMKRKPGRIVNGVERWSNQTDTGQNKLSPGNERWKDRSRTFPGVASALVEYLLLTD